MPVESVIHDQQESCYASLSQSDAAGEATPFISFVLNALYQALGDFLNLVHPPNLDVEQRLEMARKRFGAEWFARKEYLTLHKSLRTAQASRDLRRGVDEEKLLTKGKVARTRYRFDDIAAI